MIERTTDAAAINAILNHPAVRPTVADVTDGPLDVSDRVSNPDNVSLVGEYGAIVFFKYCDGIYEVHTQILPEGRGKWACQFAQECLRYMFTSTDCIEVITRVPQGHIGAKALTEMMGFRLQFTTPPECRFRGELVPAYVYSLTLQEWFPRAPGLEECGEHFHLWLNKQVGDGEPHGFDPGHNRVVGLALGMAAAGQIRKAVVFYNTRAVAARHATITLLTEDPARVKFDAGLLTVVGETIRFERAH